MSRERPGKLCVVNGADSGPGDWGQKNIHRPSVLMRRGKNSLKRDQMML